MPPQDMLLEKHSPFVYQRDKCLLWREHEVGVQSAVEAVFIFSQNYQEGLRKPWFSGDF